MHPVIRILCLLILAGFLARGGWRDLALVGLLLAALYSRQGLALWVRLLRVLRRLRVLFFSIAIIYVLFTPGDALWPALGAVSPTREGLEEGALRALALVALAAAVQLLVLTTTREQLIAAIRWWAQPLRLFGLSPDKLALRMVLALEAVPKLKEVAARVPEHAASAGKLGRIAARAEGVFGAALDAAEAAPLPAVEVPVLPRPAAWQWLAPALLAGALGWLR